MSKLVLYITSYKFEYTREIMKNRAFLEIKNSFITSNLTTTKIKLEACSFWYSQTMDLIVLWLNIHDTFSSFNYFFNDFHTKELRLYKSEKLHAILLFKSSVSTNSSFWEEIILAACTVYVCSSFHFYQNSFFVCECVRVIINLNKIKKLSDYICLFMAKSTHTRTNNNSNSHFRQYIFLLLPPLISWISSISNTICLCFSFRFFLFVHAGFFSFHFKIEQNTKWEKKQTQLIPAASSVSRTSLWFWFELEFQMKGSCFPFINFQRANERAMCLFWSI